MVSHHSRHASQLASHSGRTISTVCSIAVTALVCMSCTTKISSIFSLDAASSTGPGTTQANVTSTYTDSPIRRLSALEYTNSLTSVLQSQFVANGSPNNSSNPAQAIMQNAFVVAALQELPTDTIAARLDTNQTDGLIDNAHFTAYTDIAVTIANVIAGSSTYGGNQAYLNAFVPSGCGAQAGSYAAGNACSTKFINQFGQLAYRAPVSAADFQTAQAGATSWSALIARILMNPRFFMKIERAGTLVNGTSNVYKLSPYELEARLASVYWKSVPDQTGINAAASGSIMTPSGLTAEINRMLSTQAAKDAMWAFYQQYFNAPAVPNFGDDQSYQYQGMAAPFTFQQLYFNGSLANPTQNQNPEGLSLRDAILEDGRQFLEYFTWQTNGKLDDIFSSNLMFTIDPNLAQIYGLSAPRASASAPPLTAPGGHYPGILTRAMVTTQNPGIYGQVNQILRGVFMTTNIMNTPLGAPAPLGQQQALASEITSSMSTLKQVQTLTSPSTCQACHSMINPNGAILWNYDTLGRYMTTETLYTTKVIPGPNDTQVTVPTPLTSNTVDTTVTTSFGSLGTQTVPDLPTFISTAIKSGQLYQGFANYYFRFAMGKVIDPSGGDACFTNQLVAGLSGAQGSVLNMLKTFPLASCFQQAVAPQ